MKDDKLENIITIRKKKNKIQKKPEIMLSQQLILYKSN